MAKLSDRLLSLPPYIFSEINKIKQEATRNGIELLSLAIGDPDLPTPEPILQKIKSESDKVENHQYSPYEGSLRFRKQVSEWFKSRFQVSLNPESEIIALIGSKEGLSHFPLAILNPGDKAIYPSPGYPIFQTGILLSGATAIPLPLRPENQFLPDLNELEDLLKTHRPKYCLLNFPSNPTSQMASRKILEGVVALARKYQTILGYDNAYSEIYSSDSEKPLSILEIPGAKEVAIEFHSFSKTFNMTGWRLGFACGNEALVQALLKVKTNVDSGPLLAIQEAGVYALQNQETLVQPIRDTYRKRIEIFTDGLKTSGIEFLETKATFFVWCKVPTAETSMDFVKRLIASKGLVLTPGIGFGEHGEGYFRVSLTVPEAQLARALEKISSRL